MTMTQRPAPRGPRELQKERTRDKLLEAARTLFADGGYMTCTVGDIVERAGVSRAAFYLHFASKQDLLNAIVARTLAQMQDRFLSLSFAQGGSRKDILVAWIGRQVREFRRLQGDHRLFSLSIAINPQAATDVFASSAAAVAALGRRLPELRILDAAGAVDLRRLAGLNFLIFEMQQLAVTSAYDAWVTDLDTAIDVLANRFLTFLYAD